MGVVCPEFFSWQVGNYVNVLSIRYSVNSTNILYMHMDIMGIAKST